MKQESEDPVPVIILHDLVSMAQVHFFAVYGKDAGALVDFGFESFLKKRPHVEVMVSFEIDNMSAAVL